MRNWSLIAALCLVPLTTGCLAAAAAGVVGVVGYVYYERNEATQEFAASFEETWEATVRTLRELNYAIPDAPQPLADAGTIDTEELWVEVARHPGRVTRVSVRVGTFDTQEHRRRAGLILEHIGQKL